MASSEGRKMSPDSSSYAGCVHPFIIQKKEKKEEKKSHKSSFSANNLAIERNMEKK